MLRDDNELIQISVRTSNLFQFETDYEEFKSQFDALQAQIQKFMDSWFEKNLTVSQ